MLQSWSSFKRLDVTYHVKNHTTVDIYPRAYVSTMCWQLERSVAPTCIRYGVMYIPSIFMHRHMFPAVGKSDNTMWPSRVVDMSA